MQEAVSRGAAFERVRPVADAVLYEGYLLYPYRRSSPKNRVRWQFGVLAPRPWAERNGPVTPSVAGSTESWFQQTECLLQREGDIADAVVRARVRYLQPRHKGLERPDADGGHVPVRSLTAGGMVHLAFDEAVERERDIEVPLAALCDPAGGRAFDVGAPGGEEAEPLPGGVGRVVRRSRPVAATTTLTAEPLDGPRGLYRLRLRTENAGQGAGPGDPREEALRHALVACHTFLGGDGLSFLSLTDPPDWAARHATGCRNVHTFPVLAGEPGTSALMLSSPILLPDHPQLAPESPGDLYDATEIDEILSLRTMLLTDEEKREARATDPRAARILDRVDDLPPEALARLHGAIRSLRPAEPDPRAVTPWWQEREGEEGASPATDSVLVDGVPVTRGSRVRLRPGERGADAHDMFLAGRTARVAAVFHDVEGGVQLAVTLDDDPAAELHAWYGRFFYFRPDEIQPYEPYEPHATATAEETPRA
jgi:hypothetical protein